MHLLQFEVVILPESTKPQDKIDRNSINTLPSRRQRNSIKLEKLVLVTTRQIKAARALLAWSQADLADRSRISEPTVARLEAVDGELGGRGDTTQKIRDAIEAAGVEFIDENGGGLGVRFRKPAKGKSGK